MFLLKPMLTVNKEGNEGKTIDLPVDIFTAEFTMSPEEARKNLESGHLKI